MCDCPIRVTAVLIQPLTYQISVRSLFLISLCYYYLIQNSQAVKKNECSPQNGYGEIRCEIQGGGQEMAVMVG